MTLYGVMEGAPAAPGVLISNLGASGSNSTQCAAANNASFNAAIAATGCDLFQIILGTNDASGSLSPAQYKANIRTLDRRLGTARPTADILLTAPAQHNDLARPMPISLYADALYRIALDADVAFTDLQPSFGAGPADDSATSARPYFDDEVHPGP